MFQDKVELAKTLLSGELRNSSLGKFLLKNSLENPFVAAAEYLLWRRIWVVSFVFLSVFIMLFGAILKLLGLSWLVVFSAVVLGSLLWVFPVWLMKSIFGRNWASSDPAAELERAGNWLEEVATLLRFSESDLLKNRDCLLPIVQSEIDWRMEELVKSEAEFKVLNLAVPYDWEQSNRILITRSNLGNEMRTIFKYFMAFFSDPEMLFHNWREKVQLLNK